MQQSSRGCRGSTRSAYQDPCNLCHLLGSIPTSFTTEIDVRILFGKACHTFAPNATSSPGQTTRKRVHGSCGAARFLHDVQVQRLNGFLLLRKPECRCRLFETEMQVHCHLTAEVDEFVRFTRTITPPLPLHPILLLLHRCALFGYFAVEFSICSV